MIRLLVEDIAALIALGLFSGMVTLSAEVLSILN